MIDSKIFHLFCAIMLSAVSTTFPSNVHSENSPFWVSPNGNEIVVQSGDTNETYYFNNAQNQKCYTFKVIGKWQLSSQSMSLLEIRESESDDRLAVESGGEVTTWVGANAGIYLYSPQELAEYEGEDPISQAALINALETEQRYDTTLSDLTLESFECSWPKAAKLTTELSIILDGEKTLVGDEKVLIDLGQGWVAQITFRISEKSATVDRFAITNFCPGDRDFRGCGFISARQEKPQDCITFILARLPKERLVEDTTMY